MSDIRCTRCLKDKPKSDYYPTKLHKNGETGRCKVCTDIAVNKWKHENPKVVVMHIQRARKRDPEKHKARDRRMYQNRKMKALNN